MITSNPILGTGLHAIGGASASTCYLPNTKMGHFQFASWVLHMSMLIFFSFIVGVIMKEWKNVKPKTYLLLIIGLLILIASFTITSYGSYIGEQIINGHR